MLAKIKFLIVLTTVAVGSVAYAEESRIDMKIGEVLHGMQININLKTRKERHFGDMCNLTFVKNLNGAFLINADPGITSPNSLAGSGRFMTVKQINKDTLIGIGSEQHYMGEGSDIIVKRFNDKIIIKLNQFNAPDSYELTSENNIDQALCEDLRNVGI